MNSANNNKSKMIRTQQKTNMQFINKKNRFIQVYNDNQIDRSNFVKSLVAS
jgi:hypothetical protein